MLFFRAVFKTSCIDGAVFEYQSVSTDVKGFLVEHYFGQQMIVDGVFDDFVYQFENRRENFSLATLRKRFGCVAVSRLR